MSDSFLCSIVIATYNRSELLNETLQSLSAHLRQSAVKGRVQIVLINNNSSDETADVAAFWADRFQCFEYYLEISQGLSHARNSGIDRASSDIVIFLDDDVEIVDGWLPALLAPFSRDEIGVVGGKVLPYGMVGFPSWLPREYGYLASVFDPYDKPQYVDKVMGANFAVRRSVFKLSGNFDVRLGRKGKKLLGGEEVELFRRVQSAGFKVFYTPSAVVLHKISSKLTKAYIADYAYWLGVSEAHLDQSAGARVKHAIKVIRSWVFPVAIYPFMSALRYKPETSVRYEIKTKYAKGYLASRNELSR